MGRTKRVREDNSFTIATPKDFRLSESICSYGYFVLAPNNWEVSSQTFSRPFRNGNGLVYHLVISQIKDAVMIESDKPVASDARADLTAQIHRMLHLDLDLTSFHNTHPEAARRGFGRLFRSPTLFEDMVHSSLFF